MIILNSTNFKQIDANIPLVPIIKGIFTGLGYLATTTENVRAILESTGVTSEESEKGISKLSSSPTDDSEIAKQIQKLNQTLLILQADLEKLRQENPKEATNVAKQIRQAYNEEISSYKPREKELIKQNLLELPSDNLLIDTYKLSNLNHQSIPEDEFNDQIMKLQTNLERKLKVEQEKPTQRDMLELQNLFSKLQELNSIKGKISN
jgi:hypothetical protein